MLKVPNIKGQQPRILLVTQDYFIIPELLRALKGLGISFVSVEFRQDASFLEELFGQIASFRPHFILSINHAGLDADGQVLALLKRCGVPFASWFVDRQEMFLRSDVDPDSLLAVFSWDPEAAAALRKRRVPYAHYLPLAADTSIFYPRKVHSSETYPVSFVGSSWTGKIADVLRAGKFPAILLRCYKRLGEEFESDPSIDLPVFIEHAGSDVLQCFEALSPVNKEMYLRLIQLQATRIRRIRVVSALLEFEPVIVGDSYWGRVLAESGRQFTWWSRLSYEEELPDFYRQTLINFNATSLQSCAALNQRVFDVPACGAFLLTEQGSSLEKLFDPGLEVACYSSVDDGAEAVSRWLSDKQGRERIARAGMKRVQEHHTYLYRIVEIISKMRLFY